jgi:hypothetical protein
MIAFDQLNVNQADVQKISEIAKRTVQLHLGRDMLSVMMDLEVCHAIGCKLDLDRLLAFPVLDFAHDVLGIAAHLDHDTGRLLDCFLPRCAV